MTTHFTSGVTNVVRGTLGKIKQPDPTKYHTYFNDFDVYTSGDWTVTTTEAGSGSATEAIIDGDGGLLALTNAAGDDDNDFLQLKKETLSLSLLSNCILRLDLRLQTPMRQT